MKIYTTTVQNFKAGLIMLVSGSLIFLSNACQIQPTQSNQTTLEKLVNDPKITTLANSDQMLGHDLCSDGKILVTGSFDKAVSLWDVSSKKLLHRFHGHSGFVAVTSLSSDGRLVASCDNKTIKVWDVVTHVTQKRFVLRLQVL